MYIKGKVILLVFGLMWSLTSIANVSAETLVGSVSGDANNDMGNLSYKLPLQVPKGVNGISPSIGLNYSSGSNTGFSLSATSVISRCVATKKIDGFRGHIGFSSVDRYCLDGQRLIAVAGLDGGVGSDYGTEQKNYSRVSSVGGSVYNPGSWEVHTKDGYILKYGLGSHKDAQAKGRYRWYLSSKEDRFGNKINYFYNNLGGKKTLSRITYSMHEVKFVYQAFGAAIKKYEYGKMYNNNHILTSVEIYTDSTIRRKYVLGYENAGIANRKRLKDIQLCDGNGSCTNPTVFSWHQSPNVNSMLRDEKVVFSGAKKFANYQYVDVTSDGKPDICYYNQDKRSNGEIVCNNKPSVVGPFSTSNKQKTANTLQFKDLNKDGYLDYCLTASPVQPSSRHAKRRSGGTYCGINRGNGTFAPVTKWLTFTRAEETLRKIKYVDIDNDKFTDLCIQTRSKLTCKKNNRNNKFERELQFNIAFADPKSSYFTDINGDGRQDICGFGASGFGCHLNTSNANTVSFSAKRVWSGHSHFIAAFNGNKAIQDSFRITDFNGDALPDACYLASNHLYCAINNGNRFVSVNAVTSRALSTDAGWGPLPTGDNAKNLILADINHDGLVDACTHYGSGTFQCAYNNGQGKLGFMQEYAQFDPMLDLYKLPGYGTSGCQDSGPNGEEQCGNVVGSAAPITFVDVNGDAKTDVCYHSRAGVSCALSQAIAGDNLLKSVSTSFMDTTFEYAVLSEGSNYKQAANKIAGMFNIAPSLVALKAVVTDNPAGGTNRLSYQYEGLRYDLEDGMRAFAKITKTHSAKHEKTVSSFHQQGRLNGRAKQSTIFVNDVKVSENNYTYRQINDGKRYEIRNIKTVSKTYDIQGTLLNTNEKAYNTYDRFGNLTEVTETNTGNGERLLTTTTSTYLNDEQNWILGKPTSVRVEHQSDSSTITKYMEFSYDNRGALIEEIKEPGHPLSLTTTYSYDTFGNKTDIVIADLNGKQKSSATIYDAQGLNPETASNALGHTQQFVYDKFCNKPTSTTGPNGLTTRWQYDGLCRKTSEQRADGTSTQISYSSSDAFDLGVNIVNTSKYKVVTVSSGSSPATVYYDAFGNVTRSSKTGFNGKIVLEDMRYDARGLLVSKTLPYYEGLFAGDNTAWLTTSYDDTGRKIIETRPSKTGSISVQFSYYGNTVTITDALGNQRIIVKNIQGKVAQVTEPDGGTIINTYDAVGNKTSVTVNGKVTSTMVYDIMDNKEQMSDISMGDWLYEYNAFGELIKQTDAKQQVTTIAYDLLGRIESRTSKDEASQFFYDTADNGIGKIEKEVSPAKTVLYSYDQLGRVTSTESTIADKVFAQGIEYDEFSRPSVMHYPNNLVINRNYTAQGYLKSLSMPKSQVWTPDLLGLERAMKAYMKKIEQLNNEAATYEVQARVLIQKAVRARAAANWYANKAVGFQRTASSLRTYASRYDSYANYWLRKASTFRSQAAKYYRQLGNSYVRLISISGSTARYYGTKKRGKKRYRYNWYLSGFFGRNAWPRYLHVGRLLNRYAGYYSNNARYYRSVAANNRAAANNYTRYAASYNARARQLRANANQYYAQASQLTAKLRAVQNKLLDYQGAVDTIQANLDSLQAASAGDMILWAATSMDASDRLSGQVYGNGVLTRRVYDNLTGRVDRIHSEHGNTQLRDLRFEYNQNDSVTRMHNLVSGLDQNYSYDVKDQLLGMTSYQNGNTTSYNYTYDSFGNMTTKSNVGTMTYDAGNRLTSLTRNNGTQVNYQYDANGNQISGSGRTINWTTFNKASSIVSDTMITDLSYDANHSRVLQSVTQGANVEQTYYVGGGYEHVSDTRASTEKFRINLYAGSELIGVYIKTLTGGSPELDRLRYFHKDALGNVDMITDIDGRVVANQTYSPFGMRVQKKNTALQAQQITNNIKAADQATVGGTLTASTAVSIETNRGFTGHEHLDNGLINMNARLFDPETGRFLSADIYIQDPNLLLSHNRYIYVLNNPMKYTDPSGHFAMFIAGAIISYVASQSDDPYVRTIGMIVGSAMMGGAFGGESLFTGGSAFSNGLFNSMSAGFVSGGISGGDMQSAVRGGISAGITYGIGHGGADGKSIFGSDSFFTTAIAHGTAQGIIAETSGGSFRSGFASGFISHLSSGATGDIGGNDGGAIVARTTVAAIFGGMASQATGGSFEDGAFQAAMVHLFNAEAGRNKVRRQKQKAKGYSVSMEEVKGALYSAAKQTEDAMKPLASATAYAALATRNPALVIAASISTGTGLGAIMIQEFIYPDMVQAIDLTTNFAFEMIAPKPIRPIAGYMFDITTDIAR